MGNRLTKDRDSHGNFIALAKPGYLHLIINSVGMIVVNN
jgi:hypothetical protein